MIFALENKEVCLEEMIFLWDLEKPEGFYQVKKSRQNIPGKENVINSKMS